MIRRYCAAIVIVLLSFTVLTGCIEDSEQGKPFRAQVYPVSLSPGEEHLMTVFTNTYYLFEFMLQVDKEDVLFEIWIEHYREGQLVNNDLYLLGMTFPADMEARVVKERILIAPLFNNEEEDLWIANIGGGTIRTRLPKLTGTAQTWGSTPNMDIIMGQPVILGFLASGDNNIRPPQPSFYDGDSGAFNELISANDEVYIIYLQVSLN